MIERPCASCASWLLLPRAACALALACLAGPLAACFCKRQGKASPNGLRGPPAAQEPPPEPAPAQQQQRTTSQRRWRSAASRQCIAARRAGLTHTIGDAGARGPQAAQAGCAAGAISLLRCFPRSPADPTPPLSRSREVQGRCQGAAVVGDDRVLRRRPRQAVQAGCRSSARWRPAVAAGRAQPAGVHPRLQVRRGRPASTLRRIPWQPGGPADPAAHVCPAALQGRVVGERGLGRRGRRRAPAQAALGRRQPRRRGGLCWPPAPWPAHWPGRLLAPASGCRAGPCPKRP